MAEERKSATVLVRMEPSLYKKLYRSARANERSVPAEIRVAIRLYLAAGAK